MELISQYLETTTPTQHPPLLRVSRSPPGCPLSGSSFFQCRDFLGSVSLHIVWPLASGLLPFLLPRSLVCCSTSDADLVPLLVLILSLSRLPSTNQRSFLQVRLLTLHLPSQYGIILFTHHCTIWLLRPPERGKVPLFALCHITTWPLLLFMD